MVLDSILHTIRALQLIKTIDNIPNMRVYLNHQDVSHNYIKVCICMGLVQISTVMYYVSKVK